MASNNRKRTGNRELFLLLLAAITFAATAATYFYLDTSSFRDREWLTLTRNLQQQVTELGAVGDNAARGLAPDFRALEGAQANVADNIFLLREGDELIELPPPPAEALEALNTVEDAWLNLDDAVNQILDGRGTFNIAERTIFEIRRKAGEAQESIQAEQAQLTQSAANTGRLLALARSQVALEQIRAESLRVIGAGRDADRTIAAINDTMQRLLDDLARSGIAQDSKVRTEVAEVEKLLSGLTRQGRRLTEVQESASSLSQLGTAVTSAAIDVEDSLTAFSRSRPVKQEYLYYFAGATVALLTLFVIVFLAGARRRSLIAERSERDQQEAIMRLLDEIGDLADGDLTISATVSEDFTGAIADSINFAIETLRTLVGTIQSTSFEVASAAASTLDRSDSLNDAAAEQSSRVQKAAQSVDSMNASVQELASEAQTLSQQSELSLETARSGGETVRRSIDSMESLREQIQDTSKRIKRLGESSQEIGNIIEFINDIAEQTNTLALNAAIQAAMAGEAGRGFGVVADEVQRLAERAADATRQIEGLVKTIQADTNEAIVSMERSTTNVVSGAGSAAEAGQALEKVESFANDLAALVQRITQSAETQRASSQAIREEIDAVEKLAQVTASTAGETATNTRKLTDLSDKLRESIAGFRLSDEPAGDTLHDSEKNDADTYESVAGEPAAA